jgi:hypothetical protein
MTTTTEPETATQPESAPKPRSLRRRVLSRISIQSKLLAMLLMTSILSAAVVGAIGYQSGRSSLRASVFDRLTEIRGSQSRQLEAQFSDLMNSLIVYTRGSTLPKPLRRSPPAFDQVNDATISPAQWQSIIDYYNYQWAAGDQSRNHVDNASWRRCSASSCWCSCYPGRTPHCSREPRKVRGASEFPRSSLTWHGLR